MKSLGQEVPSVDTKLAEANKSKTKPSAGFAPWKPLVDFADAIVGTRPDIFKEAKKTMGEIARNREAAKPVAGDPATGEIGGEIRKNANGDTSTSVSTPDSSPDSPGNGVKKATTTPRYEKKTTKKTS
jgi:hypothetical protein